MFILPINRDAQPRKRPYVTYGLIFTNSVIWLLATVMGQNTALINTYGYRAGTPSLLTLFTSMFLHVGLLHVAGNMWFLWMFAPKIEERLGGFWFLLGYVICGMGGTCLYTLLAPGSLIPCVGASGAISGVTGMYFVLFPRSPFDLVLYFGWFRLKSFRAQTRGAVGTWIGEQAVLGLLTTALGSNGGGVAFWAHVGGFVTGLICGALDLPWASRAEREQILHPLPLTQEEKDEIFADRVEKPSELTTLKLS